MNLQEIQGDLFDHIPAVRFNDPDTSHKAADDINVRVGTQRYKILSAFGFGGAMTADEAQEASGVPVRSCYWKRVSELRSIGLISDTGVRRMGSSGSDQIVSIITAKGREVLATAS